MAQSTMGEVAELKMPEKISNDDLAALKRSRSALKGRVSMAMGNIDIAIADEDESAIEACINTAKSVFDKFSVKHIEYHEQVILLDVDNDISVSQKYFIDVQVDVTNKIKLARKWLSDANKSNVSLSAQSTMLTQNDNSMSFLNSEVSAKEYRTHRI